MKTSKRNANWDTAWTAVQLVASIYSTWSIWRRHQHDACYEKAHYDDIHDEARQSITPALLPADNKHIESTTDNAPDKLKQESYPKALWRIAASAANAWSSHRAASKGAALALYTLFSLAPLLILVVTIADLFFGEDSVRQSLREQMQGLIGPQGSEAINTIVAGARHKSDSFVAGLISAALVLISATSAFAELKDSLDELWEVPKNNESGLWAMVRERFLSFGLILVLTMMLLASLAVSTALAALGNIWGGFATDSFEFFAKLISNVASFLIVTALFAVIFKYLPAARITWKDVFVGALLTAVLFIAGKAVIGLYLGHGDLSSSYGTAGSIVALITWIYYSAQIFFYGSLFTHEYALKLGSRAQRR